MTFLLALSVTLQRRLLRALLQLEMSRMSASESTASTACSSVASPPARPASTSAASRASGPASATAASHPPSLSASTAVASASAGDPPASRAEQRIRARGSSEPQPEPLPSHSIPASSASSSAPAVPAQRGHGPTIAYGPLADSDNSALTGSQQTPVPAMLPPGILCTHPCINPACTDVCGRRDNPRKRRPHRSHACQACHARGWWATSACADSSLCRSACTSLFDFSVFCLKLDLWVCDRLKDR